MSPSSTFTAPIVTDIHMFSRVVPYLLVGLGGLVGSICRYGTTLLLARTSLTMPYGTLTSNIAGCLIIGMVSEIGAAGELLSPATRLLLATGFCGGFTTLSSLIYELAQMIKDGEWFYAILYLNGTLVGAALAFIAGVACVRTVLRIV
jgi:CrcB protein